MVPTMNAKIKIILGIETFAILVLIIVLIAVTTSKSGESAGGDASIVVEEAEFGHTSKHDVVKKYTLRRGDNFKVELISYGAAIKSIYAQCKHGHLNNRVLGFNTIQGILNMISTLFRFEYLGYK